MRGLVEFESALVARSVATAILDIALLCDLLSEDEKRGVEISAGIKEPFDSDPYAEVSAGVPIEPIATIKIDIETGEVLERRGV